MVWLRQLFGRGLEGANVLGGILLAAFFVLHPGGGDPPGVQAALSPVYGLEHTLGLASMALLMLGLVGLSSRVAPRSGALTGVAYSFAYVGNFLLGGVVYFDGFFVPVIAARTPAMLAVDGPLNMPPVVLAFAIPGIIWGLGYLVLAAIGLQSGVLPRWGSALVLVGAIIVNLPPQPIGPAPLWLIATGSALMGTGLVWWGWALRAWPRSIASLQEPQIAPATG